MKARNRISFLPALGAAVAFIPKGFSKAWLALLAWPVALFIFSYAAEGATDQAKCLGLIFLIGLFLISRLMAVGALYRAALDNKTKEIGFGGIQLRGAELRIIASGLLAGLIAGLLSLAVAIPIGFAGHFAGVRFLDFAKTMNAAVRDWRVLPALLSRPNGGALLAAVTLQLVLVNVFIARLSLWLPATVKEGRIVVTDSLGLTRGATLTMLAGYLLLVAGPPQILQIVFDHFELDAARISQWVHLGLDPERLNLVALLLVDGVLAPILAAGFLAGAYRAATRPSVQVSEAMAQPLPGAAPDPAPVA